MYFKRYDYGDCAVYFAETPVEGHEKKTTVGFAVLPKDVPVDPKTLRLDSLVQVAFTGDETLADYTPGATMRNRSSTLLKIERQTQFMSGVLNTHLTDGKGNDYIHRLVYDRKTGVFTVNVKYENHTGAARTLEHLSSFSLGGIATGAGNTAGLVLHRMRSAWSRECRLTGESFSALGLDMSWARYGMKVERWGQVGSMPNRGYYPFAAIEDTAGHVCWGVQIEAPYSWQMEVYQEKETCSLSGGLADFEFGHWRKIIPAGGTFTTHAARFTVKRSLLEACNALVHEADSRLAVPGSEESMPVLFNEYCTTWGSPSERNVAGILRAIKDLPVDYFVIDCGWYKPDGKGWCNAIGDWKQSAKLFPNGIRAAAEKIKAAGKRPGIWFEFEVAGRDSELFLREDMLLKRDGAPITAKNRRFLDLRLPAVREYLDGAFLSFLRENGFEYLKIDYNDNYGMGCDGAESYGEGGRQVAEESLLWLDRIKAACPDLVIENCSSGGSRIEPLRMSKVSMCSFSDAHECDEIPLVAANVSLVVPARQSQIWAVIRENESDSRTIYSLCAAMMGRICLSGDVRKIPPEKSALIARGLAFYGSVKEIVRSGEIVAVDCNVEYYRKPEGRQVYIKDLGNRRLVIVHFLECDDVLRFPLGGYTVKASFTDLSCSVRSGALRIEGQHYRAGAFLLERREEHE